MKSFNVVLNSKKCVSGTTQRAYYYFNWTAVLDKNKQYKLEFTYLGAVNTCDGSKFPCLYIDFNMNTFYNTSATNGATFSQYLGNLKPVLLNSTTNNIYFSADITSNPAVYLPTPPLNNNFSATITDNSGALFLDTAGTPANPGDYNLVLKFTEVDNDNDSI